eukprot:TRINITY_DN68759_c0_g1_i1.p1 TRINITY_DN68759_c0_g1~~TRINITY_DN68759_c0_g1_i1.p1  ORF type:complete len:413 (+),score=55.51 TRINITY_DN68759_c0_g1_i1:94-1239(+)
MASGRTIRVAAGAHGNASKRVKKTQKARRRVLRRRSARGSASTPSSPEPIAAALETVVAGGRKSPSPKSLRKKRIEASHSRKCLQTKTELRADPQTQLEAMQALVVNLDRRPDRLQECAERLQAHCPWLRYTRMRASDGKLDNIPNGDVTFSWHTGRNTVYQKIRSRRKGWDDLHTYVVRELTLSAGERGCASSHVRAWRQCVEMCSPGQPLLVLEDDAVPMPNFTEVMQRTMSALPSDADVLYLGYSQAAEWRRELSQELVEAEYVWTTVAYVVWPAGARKLLSKLPVNQPVDNFMATLCADGDIKAYCTRPKIVRQADGWNVGSDIGHSDEAPPPGMVTSDIFHTDDRYWGIGPANPNLACSLGPFDSDIAKSDDRYWG